MTIPTLRISSRTIYIAFLHVAVIVLGVEVFLLARQNRELRSMAEPPQAVRVGDRFPLGPLRHVSGIADIDTTRPMLLFLFSTRCGVCEKSIPGWNAIYRELGISGVQTAGIVLDSIHVVSGFVTNHAVEFPAFVPEIPAVFAAVASVRFVPQTVLRTSDGVVVFSWPGMMSDSLRSVVVTAARGRHSQP